MGENSEAKHFILIWFVTDLASDFENIEKQTIFLILFLEFMIYICTLLLLSCLKIDVKHVTKLLILRRSAYMLVSETELITSCRRRSDLYSSTLTS